MQLVEDGLSAFRALTAPDAAPIAIIDWMMPDLTGPELCAKLRKHDPAFQPYLIILSGRKEKADIVTFAIETQPSPLAQKTTEQLQLFDILARPYPPADTHQVPLLRGGVALKESVIEKLRLFTQAAADAPPILVHRPSAMALHHHARETAARTR
jgi:CheY-like chemotaxis protein